MRHGRNTDSWVTKVFLSFGIRSRLLSRHLDFNITPVSDGRRIEQPWRRAMTRNNKQTGRNTVPCGSFHSSARVEALQTIAAADSNPGRLRTK